MGYPNPLKVSTRKITDNIVTSSCAFKVLDKINLGARMALISQDDNIIVWSAIPYGEEVENALKVLVGERESYNVSHLIVPNIEHSMAAKSFKQKYPNLKIMAPEKVELGESCPVDYKFTAKYGNKVLDSTLLGEIGIKDSAITKNFEFVYLPFHKNSEIVTFDKTSKTIFEADVLSNLDPKQKLEQFSPATGFAEDFFPHLGWSFVTRYLQPYSKVGAIIAKRVTGGAKSAEGVKAIHSWNFERIIMCHGNIIEQGAKDAFAATYSSVL